MSRELDWTYYLAGSTAASVIWAFVTLFAMLLVVESVRDKQKAILNELRDKKLVEPSFFFLDGGNRRLLHDIAVCKAHHKVDFPLVIDCV